MSKNKQNQQKPTEQQLRDIVVEMMSGTKIQFDPAEVLKDPMIRIRAESKWARDNEERLQREAAERAVREAEEEAEKVKAAECAKAELSARFDAVLGLTEADKVRVGIQAWTRAFADGNVSEGGLPVLRKDEAGSYLCGLPHEVLCCDKRHVVERFALYGEAIYGLCANTAMAYDAARKAERSPILATFSLEEAEKVAKEMSERIAPAANWARIFVTTATGSMPAPRLNEDGKHFCGIPAEVSCCDKQQAVNRFAALGGEVYGLCYHATRAFRTVLSEGYGDFIDRVKYTDWDKIQSVAAAQRRNASVLDYVRRFAVWDSQIEYPRSRFVLDKDGNATNEHLCGLPDEVPCCDKQRPVKFFASSSEGPYGLCGTAGTTCLTVFNSGEFGKPSHLLWAKDLSKAQEISDNLAIRNSGGNNSAVAKLSPLGNKTDPEYRARRETHLAERSEVDRQLREKSRGPRGSKPSYQHGGKKNKK